MPTLFSKAAEKGRTVWLKSYLTEHLPELQDDQVNHHAWFINLIQFMEDRGLLTADRQKDYLSDTRNAIKVLDPHHPALEEVNFDKETWTAINNRNSDRIAERTTKFIDNPDAIVKKASILLKSYQWSEIAAGLAVVTGRRVTEVIKTAQFDYKSKHSVIFTGALKRGNEPVECVFEIPTLVEAQLVIEAISSLREKLGTKIDNLSKRKVSSRYSKSVASKCNLYFTRLVPRREDKDNLYTHLFRAIYATIASYWFCPPTVPEMEYRAAIQGHYQILDEKNPELRRSLAAGRHYFDYKIGDGHGNIDGRLGIKLGLPDIKIIEPFEHLSQTHHSPKTKQSNNQLINPKRKRIMTSQSYPITIPSFYQSRLEAISEKLGISQDDVIQELFTWTEMGLSLADSLDIEEPSPQEIFESVEQLKNQVPDSSSKNINSNSELIFDQDSINQICTSVRLLSEAVSLQSDAKTSINRRSPSKKATTNKAKSVKTISSNHTSTRKRSQRSIDGEKRVNKGIDVIMEFNNDETLPSKDKWYIGVGCLRKLTQNGDKVINRVLQTRKEEIDAHHSLHQLSKWDNARGKDYPSIETVISFPAE